MCVMVGVHGPTRRVCGCCNYPCAGPAPLGIAVAVAIGIAVAVAIGIAVAVAIGIAGVTQLRCASVEATQLGMGIGSAPEGARTQEPALERWEWRWAYGYKGTVHSTVE